MLFFSIKSKNQTWLFCTFPLVFHYQIRKLAAFGKIFHLDEKPFIERQESRWPVVALPQVSS